MRSLLLLLVAGAATAAPVPRAAPADPLGRGYLGIFRVEGTLVIQRVEADMPAARAGMRAGDAIISIGDCTPANFDEFVLYVANLRPGTVVRVVTRRGVETRAVTLRLGARPDNAGSLPASPSDADKQVKP